MTSPSSGNAESAKTLARIGRPVLMLDTCILLDVIRAPFRRDIPNDTIARAAALMASCTSSASAVQIVVASLVPREFEENVVGVSGELEGHCGRLIEHALDADAACDALGVRRTAGFIPGSLDSLTRLLPALARDMLRSATVLSADNEILARSQIRNVQGLPPSTKGTQSKDPQIFEECLDLARRLRTLGFVVPIVFCSSDKKAYGDDGPSPHPQLAAELTDPTVDVRFTSNLPWAWHELGLQSPQ